MANPAEHPAELSTLGKLWEGAKHIGKKALKWAAIGGLVGGIIMALPALVATGPVGGLLSMLPIIGPTIGSWVASGIGGAFAAGAVGLGTVTGIIGAVKGLAGADDAVQQAEDRKVANYERGEARQMKVAMMQRQLGGAAPSAGMGYSPGVLPEKEQELGRG